MERPSREGASHYADLLDIIAEEQQLNLGEIPISTIDSFMPRSDQAPFAEGDAFSGNIRLGNAEASLTLAASSHFRPTIPLTEFTTKASETFGQQSQLLREMPPDQKLAPHMIVWWHAFCEAQQSQVDMFDLSTLSQEDRADFVRSISQQIVRAFSVLEDVDGQPIIYGSWGHSEADARKRFGFSRGAPTLPDGHLHLAKVNVEDQDISLSSLSSLPTLKHYQPWNRLINQRFGIDLAFMIDRISRDGGWSTLKSVRYYDDIVQHGSSHKSHQQGYEITYQDPLLIEDALEHVVHIASKIEELYHGISDLYSRYYKSLGDVDGQFRIIKRIQELGMEFGFDDQAAEKIASFVVRITPTSGQLTEWSAGLEQDPVSEKRNLTLKIIQEKLARRALALAGRKENRDPMIAALVEDTYKDPKQHDIVHTWPAHSSAIYLFDDIEIVGDKILVNKISIHPAIVSAAGAPEKLLGAAIVRDMGSIA